ncbi:MAG: PssD/Cps14F family polysaccharide biosynthesis glycosyltransferase [Anaerocolumna sp.]
MFIETNKAGKLKMCCVASSGGHWEELMCLKDVIESSECFFVTEQGGQAQESKYSEMYLVTQINRHEKFFLLHFFRLFITAFRIIKKERPDIVLSTGALIAFPFCIVSKVFGAKIIFIESFARVYNKSLTGKLIYPFSDLFIVQWETMMEHYPKAKYGGVVF